MYFDSPWFFDLNPLLFTCSNSNEYFYNRVAFTEYLLYQGQGVFPLNSNRTARQRFTMVLRDEFLILDLKQIVFAVFYDVRVQFAHAY